MKLLNSKLDSIQEELNSLKSGKVSGSTENLKRLYFKHEEEFLKWLNSRGKSKGYIRDLKTAGKRFFSVPINDYQRLRERYQENLPNMKYVYLMLRNWFSFCEEYEYVEEDLLNKLREHIRNPKRSQIDSYVPSKEDMKEFLCKVKDYDYKDFVAVSCLLQSGLRVSEVIHFLNNYENRKFEIYDDIVIYPLYYLRGQKNSYYLFMSRAIYEEIMKLDFQGYTFEKLKTWIKRHEGIKLKYFRKFNFTLMIQSGIDMETANFIQGRTSTNVGFNHYLAKKEMAVKKYKEINSFRKLLVS